VFFVVWQHTEAKNTRLYELKQQLVQTSWNLFIDDPPSGDICDSLDRPAICAIDKPSRVP
jgi:hypothetical protein